MRIENPKVTLADDARIGVKEDIRSGFLDWLNDYSMSGDDGEIYRVGGTILSLHKEQMDIVIIGMAKGKGKAHDALFLDVLKHKLLSVSQMCNRGYGVIYRAQYCEIR